MRLLATVVCVEEAMMLSGAVDLLDVKNPSKGSLGAPDIKTVRDIKKAVGSATPLSVALGDLDGKTVGLGLSMASAGADIIKIGLADIRRAKAIDVFKTLKKNLPPKVRVVAAAYADAGYHRFFSPSGLPSFAVEAEADGILIDTFEKSGKKLFDFLSVYELASIISTARGLKLMTALAGSLGADDIEDAALAAPGFVGFRSAITISGNRSGHGVDPCKVSLLKDRLIKAGENRKTLSLSE
ncbi:hypothetical protein MNBD_NITROSPINAE03-1406 [hydrothermal vent metagenome]|uniref:(5-formylfuran-3-yl)methyl phosphate synthase n=1 Tax=hydrothermal vent metagenome TaxID=652676 RepID=A0A3B1BAW5_9ZZZZ